MAEPVRPVSESKLVTPPKTIPPPPPVSKAVTEKEKLLERITDILDQYRMESDIPLTHEYWQLVNKYRGL